MGFFKNLLKNPIGTLTSAVGSIPVVGGLLEQGAGLALGSIGLGGLSGSGSPASVPKPTVVSSSGTPTTTTSNGSGIDWSSPISWLLVGGIGWFILKKMRIIR